MMTTLMNHFLVKSVFGCGLLVILGTRLEAVGFFNDHARGWHWYEETIPQPDTLKETRPKKQSLPSLSPSAILARFQKRLKESLHRALVYPSRSHIQTYMRLQKIMMERAELFGKRWMEVVFTDPQLDYTATHPVNQVGMFAQADHDKEQVRQKIKKLSKTHGLFFFFSSSCTYCHAFAPIVKSFAQTYGWNVMAISMDGSRLTEFPDAVRDNGTASKLGVTVLPTLLAVHPQTETITPLSYGLSSHDQIEERVKLLVKGDDKS